jgi:hypothetical protein
MQMLELAYQIAHGFFATTSGAGFITYSTT